MTKKIFLRKLSNRLRLNYNSTEINEIINDYNEFFTAGLAEGKSEEELCNDFGNPKNIMRDIKLESRAKRRELLNFKFFIRIFLTVALLVYMMIFWKQINTNANMIKDSMIGIIIIGLLLWFVLGGKLFDGPAAIYNSKNINNKKTVYLHMVLIILTGLNYMLALFFAGKKTSLDGYLFSVEKYEIGLFVSNVFYIMIFLGFFLLVYSIYKFYNYTMYFYTVICNCIGYIAFMLCLLNMQHQLDDINNINTLITKSLRAYFVGILLSVLMTIYIHQIYRRRDS